MINSFDILWEKIRNLYASKCLHKLCTYKMRDRGGYYIVGEI